METKCLTTLRIHLIQNKYTVILYVKIYYQKCDVKKWETKIMENGDCFKLEISCKHKLDMAGSVGKNFRNRCSRIYTILPSALLPNLTEIRAASYYSDVANLFGIIHQVISINSATSSDIPQNMQ